MRIKIVHVAVSLFHVISKRGWTQGSGVVERWQKYVVGNL